jgi:hypothetical protein
MSMDLIGDFEVLDNEVLLNGAIVARFEQEVLDLDRHSLIREVFAAAYTLGDAHGQERGFVRGYDQGFDKGSEEGYSIGHEEGYDSGHEAGYSDGYEAGYEQGE